MAHDILAFLFKERYLINMRKHLRRSLRKMFYFKAWRARLVFWVGAILVGCICATLVVLSKEATILFQHTKEIGLWLPLLITPTGFVLIVWLTRNYFLGAQGSGIPQTLASLERPGKQILLTIRIAIGKFFLTLFGLMSGASVGIFSPSVHIGASIMHSLGGYTRFPAIYMRRGLILAGGAAGIAAAFNAPLAGIVFAIEEMSKSFEVKISGLVTTAVVFSGLVAMTLFGNHDYFGSSDASLAVNSAWGAVILCGVVGGLLGGLFTTTVLKLTRELAPAVRSHPYMVAFFCGILVSLFGYYSGHLASGTGYEATTAIITGTATFDPMYPLYKMGATLASFLSGIPGGIFGPSLATGAGVGANLGHWLPLAPLSAMIMLGMVGYFSGVVQSPLTAFVVVMELTNNQDMLLALMATSFIAYGTSQLVCPQPLYQTLAKSFLAPIDKDKP